MTSDRIQRQIDRLLDDADKAFSSRDWNALRDSANDVLSLDADNKEAQTYLTAAERNLSSSGGASGQPSPQTPATATATSQPTSFANGRYAVSKFLGEGGRKKVYLAHDTLLDRDVAFALIKTEGLDDIGKERVTREAQAMGRLGEHPNNVSVYDIGDESGQPFVVLPLMPGGDVEGEIANAPEHKLPLERVLQIAIDTCQGLAFAHERGILHRDIKPGNVWLATDGRAQVGDWGLAVASDRTRLTQAGMMVGTPTYMPPEQAMGGEITARSDLYSLGAMLYEMVCGRPPFVGDESVAIIGQHLNTPPVAPTWHRPDCPPALEALILRLLEKDPAKRPQSAAEVRQALQSLSQPSRGRTQTKAEPVTSPHDHDPLYRRTFVGRENEVRQLQQAFDAAMSGNGALVMVVGEPGIGKTALCEQLATYVALRGGKALVGHCYEEGSLSLPYLAFVEAMRSYVLERDPEGLRSDLGSGAADVARIVSEVRDRVSVELRPAGDPEDDRWRLLQAVTGFLRSASSVQPLVIVLEDLHWADRGTLDLLVHVARNLQGARLLLIGTYRDVEVDRAHPLSGTLAELRRVSNFSRVPLRGLTVDEVHRMYEAVRGQSVVWAQAEIVFRQTEGNPLFVQEVLRYLVEEGIVYREAGRYQARPEDAGSEAVIPQGLRDVVGKRLQRLNESTNQLLSVAAVMGRDFRLDVLQRVSALPEDELFAALEDAADRAVIEQHQAMGTVAFRFSHAFFRETLYDEIFIPRRIRLHQQIGRALEDIYGRRLDDHAAELAEHFVQSTEAADLEKAVRYAELAAQRALNVYAYAEAVRHYDQALRAQDVLDADDLVKRCELLLGTAEALGPAGSPEKAVETCEEAFSLAEMLQDDGRSSRACRIATFSLVRSRLVFGQMESWAQRADRHALPGTVDRVNADVCLAVVDLFRAESQTARKYLRSALSLAEQLGDPQSSYRAAMYLILDGEESERLQLAVGYLAKPREGVSNFTLSGYLWAAGLVLQAHNYSAEADEAWREHRRLAERTQDPLVVAQSMVADFTRALFAGDLETAVDICLRQLSLSEQGIGSGIWLQPARLLFLLGGSWADQRAQLGSRVGGRVRPLLKEVFQLAGRDPDDDELRVYSFLLSQPPPEAAIRAYLQRSTHPAPTENRPDENNHLAAARLLEAAVVAGATGLLPDLIDAVAPYSGHLLSFVATGTADIICPARFLAEASIAMGKPELARQFGVQALEVCEKVRFRPEIALIRLDLAELLLEHYPDERDTAIEHLDFAIAEFREMKMQPSLERALRHRGLLKA